MSIIQTNFYSPFTLPILNNEEMTSNNNSNAEILMIDQIQSNTNQKRNRKDIYGKGCEAKMIKEELGNFDVYNSNAYKQVTQHFGRSIRLSELLGIIGSIRIYLKTKKSIIIEQISRNEKRSFPLLIKYIERNNEFIIPYLQFVSLCDSSFQKIPLDIQ